VSVVLGPFWPVRREVVVRSLRSVVSGSVGNVGKPRRRVLDVRSSSSSSSPRRRSVVVGFSWVEGGAVAGGWVVVAYEPGGRS
jgi:hypothetical protein